MDTHHDLAIMLPNINPYLRPKGISEDKWCDLKISEMEETILSVGADQIGCFIAEPILASGGVIVPPAGYHQRSLELCKKYDIIYISDETVTGLDV